MSQHQLRDDVAVRRQVPSGRSARTVDHVGAAVPIDVLGLFPVRGDEVAHVARAAVPPVTYQPPQRSAAGSDVRYERPRQRGLRAGAVGDDGPDEHPGHASCAGGDVALGAVELGALEGRPVGLLLVERIETAPWFGSKETISSTWPSCTRPTYTSSLK